MNVNFPSILVIAVSVGLLAAGIAGAADLKHLWDFEGEQWWLDKMGRAHGIEPGESTTLATEAGAGEIGRSLKVAALIGGVDDHLTLNAAELYQPGNEGFSLVYWIKMANDQATSGRGIFDFSGNGRDGIHCLYIGTSDELAVRIDFSGAGVVLAKAALGLEDDRWHSVVVTYDSTNGLEVHIDGFGVDASAAAVAGSVSLATDPYLGSFNFNGNERQNGLGGNLDDFAFYSGVLTEEEIVAVSVRSLPPLDPIESITYGDGGITVRWPAPEGTVFSLWGSLDLVAGEWQEVFDDVEAGPDGASASFRLEDVIFPTPEILPTRMFFRVQRPTK
ncbi:MAG: hypothetical protein ACI9NC_003617 [Verrucomicrobiales bacterium]|jgi:hypothetical protein